MADITQVIFNGTAFGIVDESIKNKVQKNADDINSINDKLDEITIGGVDEIVNTWLEEHPEATTTVQDGSITESKLSTELKDSITNSISFDRALVATARHTICGDDKHYIQGGCYVSSTGHYVLAFSPISGSGTNTTILVELDTDFATVIQRVASVNYGHCNDLTYNPNTDRIYASSTGHESASANIGKVIMINPSTLAIAGTVNKLTNIVSAISYDTVNDVYYTSELIASENNKRYIFKYDADFNRIASLGEAYIIDPSRQLGQCSFCYKGEFYLVSESNYAGHHVWINTFGENPKIYQYENFAYYESESVLERNGTLYFVALKGMEHIYFFELANKKKIFDYTNELYMRGTCLKRGQDLDGVMQTGRYYETETSASTIVNTPYAMANEFTLDVVHLGYNNLYQIITTTNREVFVRRYDESWGPWMSLRSGFKFREQTVNVESYYAGGLCTEGCKEYRFSIPMEIESSVGHVTITGGSARIIQNGNVLVPTSAILSAFSEAVVTKTDIGLTVVFKLASAPSNAVNNDSIIVQLYSAKFQFAI